MKTVHTLLALGLCAAVTTSPVPASAAQGKAAASPTLRVSKKRVSAVCSDVTRSRSFKKARRKAVEKKTLSRSQTGEIATEVCRFFAASSKQQARYWESSLVKLVKQGKLTKSDKALLARVLKNPEVLSTWKPTTEFGKLLLSNAVRYGNDRNDDDDNATQQSNSGAGWVIGGIIGGIAGGLMTGGNPAGIGAGIAVGGAAGNLAETAASGSSGSSTGGGTEDDDGGDDDSSEEGGDGAGDGGGDGGGGGNG